MRWLVICLLLIGCSTHSSSVRTDFVAFHDHLHKKTIPALAAFYVSPNSNPDSDVAQRVKAAREFETQLAQQLKDFEEAQRATSKSPLSYGDEYRLATEELAIVVKEELRASIDYARVLQKEAPQQEPQFRRALAQVNHIADLHVESIKKCQKIYDKHFHGSTQLFRPEL